MNKYLEKIANFVTYHPSVKAGVIGAALGGAAGYLPKTKYEDGKVKNRTRKERVIDGALLGTVGGAHGAFSFGKYKVNGYNSSSYDNFKRGQSYSKARTVHDIHSDLGFPKGGFKTKMEATKHYKKMAMKHHPDRPGGSDELMKKINTAWDEYKKHPDGFEKLASTTNRFVNAALWIL